METTKTNKRRAKNDNRYLNYITLTTMVTKAMQRQSGRQQVDFDLAADIAWEIASQISSATVIDRAHTLTVAEILQSKKVVEAELSRSHGLELARKKPAPAQLNKPNIRLLVLAAIGIIGTLLFCALA